MVLDVYKKMDLLNTCSTLRNISDPIIVRYKNKELRGKVIHISPFLVPISVLKFRKLVIQVPES